MRCQSAGSVMDRDVEDMFFTAAPFPEEDRAEDFFDDEY